MRVLRMKFFGAEIYRNPNKTRTRRVTNFRDGIGADATKLGDWYAADNARRDINGSIFRGN
jgi:hypothetical protein